MDFINETKFDEVILNDNVVVDFSASWCGPCQLLKPILLQLEEIHKEVVFVCIDVDINTELCKKLKIMSVPVLQFYKKGKLLKQIEGYYPKEMLDKVIDKMKQMD